MRNLLFTLIVITVLTSARIEAQQSPSPQPQQSQSQPCSTNPSTVASNATSAPKLSDNAKKKIEQKRTWLQKYSPVQLPDPTSTPKKPTPTPAPCPPKAATPTPAPSASKPATITLPPDAFITLRCNPTVPDPSGRSHEPSLAWDPDDFAAPKANEVEVDMVVHNTTAKTPCYVIKTDPNTLKSFIPK